jgi:hypothetical protein
MNDSFYRIPIVFKEWKCYVQIRYYPNDRYAIALTDEDTGEPVVIATTNVPDCPLEREEVIIKDYAENEGVLEVLMDAKVVSPPLRYVRTGYVLCPVCRILVEVHTFDLGQN